MDGIYSESKIKNLKKIDNRERPLLITGSHRSGTTWLGKMLTLGKNSLLIHEPFNISRNAYKLDGLAEYWFTYAPGLPQKPARKAFDKVLSRKAGKVFGRRQLQHYFKFLRRGRLIIKDPIACFSSEWLYRNFNLQVIVLMRHPAAFVLSLKRMQWNFSFSDLLRQPELMEDWLEPFRQEIENPPHELNSRAALLWKMIYHVLLKFKERNPDWILEKHEELSRDPVNAIKNLYFKSGLEWDQSIAEKIEKFTGSQNPTHPKTGELHSMRRNSAANIKRWKQILSEKEINIIRTQSEAVAEKIYSENEW